jgi:hypothetical protein
MDIPTNDQLEALASRAAMGDNAALDELGALNERIGRIANNRMRRLEKAGKTGDAYKRIGNTLGMEKPRFSQAHTGSAESLFQSARTAAAALRQKETTLSGITDVDIKTVDGILEHFGKDPAAYTKAQKLRIADFVKTDAWKSLKNTYSSEALDPVTDAALDDEFEEAVQAFEEWDQSEMDIVELADEWFDFDQEF